MNVLPYDKIALVHKCSEITRENSDRAEANEVHMRYVRRATLLLRSGLIEINLETRQRSSRK